MTFPSLIEDLFVSVRPLADENGVSLTCKHRGAPHTIATDPRRVRQIVLNLLSNAIKFGNAKPVEVRSARLEDGGIEILVRDQGIGIAPEHVQRIFEEFVQLTRSDDQGTGLGLPISRRLSEFLGGSLTVESVPDSGSTFRLLLPAEIEDGTKDTLDDMAVPVQRAAEGSGVPDGIPATRQDAAVGNSAPESRVL